MQKPNFSSSSTPLKLRKADFVSVSRRGRFGLHCKQFPLSDSAALVSRSRQLLICVLVSRGYVILFTNVTVKKRY